MAIATLTEGNKYDQTTLQSVVIDLLAYQSEIMQHLQFEDLPGNSLTYDTLTTDSTVNFYGPNDTWTENTPTLSQSTVTLKILGGDIDVDNFLSATRTKINMTQIAIQNKVKAIQNKFLDTFFYGSVTTDPKSFDGLQTLISSTTYNTVHAGSGTGTALSVYKLRGAIDLLRERPDYLVMSKAMRRGIAVYMDSIGDKLTPGNNKFGAFPQAFDGIPIITDEHILDTETASSGAYAAATGGANTTIFFAKFDPMAICGVSHGGVETRPLGELETKDAVRYRVRWYTGLKFENLRLAGKVDGIVSTTAVGTGAVTA